MLFSSGMLSLGLVGGVSGLVHCTGATCPAAGLTASVPTAFGFTIGGLGGLAATSGSALFPTFALAGLTVGTVLGFPVSAIFTFTEAPLFGAGLSRHYIGVPAAFSATRSCLVTAKHAQRILSADCARQSYFASGLGRIWNFTALLVWPLPPS